MTFFIGIVLFLFFIVVNRDIASQFLNMHAFGIVIGGTFIVVLLLTPFKALRGVFWLVMQSFGDVENLEKDLYEILQNPQSNVKDPYGLIAQARDLWDLGVSAVEFENLLLQRAEAIFSRRASAASCLRSLGKYPPSMGMIGTVMGMIELFSNLSRTQAQSGIGSQLALAMTATLYGLLLANIVIMPLADRVEAHEEDRRTLIENTLRVLFSINNAQPLIVTERLMNVG